MSVVEAVQRDLRQMGGGLAASGLAATALALAGEMDDSSNSATSKSMCARVLADVLVQLRALAPIKEEGDRTDDLRKRREQRRAGNAAAQAAAPS